MTKVPIYRARKIDSDEYVEGFYEGWVFKHFIVTTPKDFFAIDKSTLAIHFPNMLDSQGNKIFASLENNGRGGDIMILDEDNQFCTKFYARMYENRLALFDNETDELYFENYAYFTERKVIGIKQ